MSGEEEVGKLFIGGVDKSARQEEFQSLFQNEGELEDIILMKDPEMPDRNRGFGFVKFKDPACAEKLLKMQTPLMLNGKSLDIKRCRQRDNQGGGPKGPESMNDSPNKVFVGGLPQTCNDDNLRDCFSSYGEVQHVKIMKDRNTGNLRGFAFVSFTDPEPVRRLLADRFVQFEGKTVEVKAAEHRYRFQGPDGQPAPQGGYGYQQPPQQGSYGQQGQWQQPQQPGAQGDGYNYNAQQWGGQQQPPQQQQPMSNYGNQGGYGQQRPQANQWNQNSQGYNQSYPGGNQTPSNPQYGGGYQQTQPGGYGDQYSQPGAYGNQQQQAPPAQQSYGGGYTAPQNPSYGSSQPPQQQQGSYQAPPQQSGPGYNPQGSYNSSGGYANNTSTYGQPQQQGPPPGQDPNSSGGPMRGSNYGQRVGNNTHGYHPYGK